MYSEARGKNKELEANEMDLNCINKSSILSVISRGISSDVVIFAFMIVHSLIYHTKILQKIRDALLSPARAVLLSIQNDLVLGGFSHPYQEAF